MNNPSCALVSIHPVADLEQCELENSKVNDVTGKVADLYPIAHFERATPDYKNPGNKIRHQLFKRNRMATKCYGSRILREKREKRGTSGF
jgi:hypothetical protein